MRQLESGLDSIELGKEFPQLITCDISGYSEDGEYADMKAYDLLVQAESGLVAISGAPGEFGRVGVVRCRHFDGYQRGTGD